MTEFISPDIQEASQGYLISDTFSLFYTTVQWISQLDTKKLTAPERRSYLVKANVELQSGEFLTNIRYDRIVFGREGTGGDRYDPFRLVQDRDKDIIGSLCNSYIDDYARRTSSSILPHQLQQK